MNELPPKTEMQRAYRERDASYDGLFILAVKTTGVFCRPTCPARKPLPENVEYFRTSKEALSVGYRPCKRCQPMQVDDQPAWVSDLFDEVNKDPGRRITESDLRTRSIDPATVRRYFQKHYGMTFHAYARARRMGNALAQIREGQSIDNAAFGNGFSSHSGFREAFAKLLGRPPGRSRGQQNLLFHWIRSPLGPLVAAADELGVCLLEFSDRRMLETQLRTLQRLFPYPATPGINQHLEQLQVELHAYFNGALREFTVPLQLAGSDFQTRVWSRLRGIPYGETMSYETLADAIGCAGGQRSVGRANGQNRIAIVVPCHRVIGKNGHLTGYGGGLHRKQFLLDLESQLTRESGENLD